MRCDMRQKRTLSLATLGVAVAMSVGLAACGSSTNKVTNSSSGGTSGGSSGFTVGYSGYTVEDSYFVGLLKGLQEGASKYDVKLLTTNANSSAAQQVTDIQNLLTEGAHALVVSPYDDTAVVPAVKQALAQKVPVASIADNINTSIPLTVNGNHVEEGKQEAAAVLTFLVHRYGKPEGTVVDIQGTPGTDSTGLRDQGLRDLAKKYPDIKIVATANGGWDTPTANQVMTAILQGHSNVDAVYTANSDEAVGVDRAIQAAHRFKPVGASGHIFVGGINGAPNAIAEICAGVQDMEVDWNPIKMGEETMKLLVEMHEGKHVSKLFYYPSHPVSKASINCQALNKTYGLWADGSN